MNEEAITALAREYAEWVTESEGGSNAYIPAETAIASALLRWLSRRFCIVEKERVKDEYNKTIEEAKHSHPKHQIQSRTRMRLLESLFPEIAKEVEG